MELILWRHAEAEDGIPDLDRKLTAKGHRQAEKMASFLHPRLPQHLRILASPARRAQQTAMAIADHYDTEATIAPGASPQAILEAAGWPESGGCVLVVGHQPTLGEAAALLLGEATACSIKKGAVWWFSSRERNGDQQTSLRLVISPDFL